MSEKLREKYVEFEFDDTWMASRYDPEDGKPNSGFFANGPKKIPHTSAADFVAVRPEMVCLIELKDFRGYRIENRKKFKKELRKEFAKKFSDTVSGIIGGSRTNGQPIWTEAAKSLVKKRHRFMVIVHIDCDADFPDPFSRRRHDNDLKTFKEELSKTLHWLGCKIRLTDTRTYDGELPGVAIRNLARPQNP